MKSFFLASLVLGLVSAIVVPRKANYDGYRVIRLQVGSDASRVENIIQELSLSTWNGAPRDNSEVDIVVPADKYSEFESSTADLDSSVMHENLGASIARETNYPVYAGQWSFAVFNVICARCVLTYSQSEVPTLLGSILIIHMRIISNS